MAVKKATAASKSTKAVKKTPASKITAMAAASKAAKTPAKRVRVTKITTPVTPKIDGEQALENLIEQLSGGEAGTNSGKKPWDNDAAGLSDPADQGGPFGSSDEDDEDGIFEDEDDEDEILDDEDDDEDGCE